MEIEEGYLERFLAKRTGVDEIFSTKLIRLSRQGHLCIALKSDEEPPSLLSSSPIVCDGQRYYLQKNWNYETHVLEEVRRLTALHETSIYNAEIFEQKLQEHSSKLQPEQLEAIRAAFSRSFCLICGGPGTGKTYTAGLLVEILAASFKIPHTFYVALAAPTGKAASHLEKTMGAILKTKITSSTLHRLLKCSGRIDADLVIVDEGSMMDVSLWLRLLEKIGDTTRLVILGDPDQLPPIEAGSLFAEMAPIFGVSLSRCMRTDVPELRDLAQAIRSGDADQMIQLAKLQPTIQISELIQRISPWMSAERPDPETVLQKYRRLGILNALRQGPLGVEAIQRQILNWMQERLHGQWWAVPVMVSANDPRQELYNGTFGVMIGQGKNSLLNLQGTAYFPDATNRLCSYPSPPPIELGFCLSIHKSQGSEYEEVMAIFPPGSQRLGRESLYTAVTRAKKKLELIGDEKTLRETLGCHSRRVSGFKERFFSEPQPVKAGI